MNFTNGKVNIIVYISDKKVFIDGVIHEITEVKAHNQNFSRFSFGGIYNAKIINGIMSYTNTDNGFLTTVTKTKDTSNQINESWQSYTVHQDLSVSINNSKSKLKINDDVVNIISTKPEGIHQVFVSDIGILSISKDEKLRPSMWNNININLKE